MCSLVTYTAQLNPSLHVYFISDKIVLKCVKTHDSRISQKEPYHKIRGGGGEEGFQIHIKS